MGEASAVAKYSVSSLRTQGPITTGLGLAKEAVTTSLPPFHRSRGMGPAFRQDDTECFASTGYFSNCRRASPVGPQLRAIQFLLQQMKRIVADRLALAQAEDGVAGGEDGAAAEGIGGKLVGGDAAIRVVLGLQ